MSRAGMKQLVEEFGSQKNLALVLGVTQAFVSKCFLKGHLPVGSVAYLALSCKTPIELIVHPDIAELIRLSKD